MTEAMRSTFLNCQKYPTKIHTEGKPFKCGIKTKNKTWNIIKGNNLAISYLDKNSWKSNIENGWFKTGDIGELDKQNFLTFKGRNIDNININGLNYSLNTIENLIKKNTKKLI